MEPDLASVGFECVHRLAGPLPGGLVRQDSLAATLCEHKQAGSSQPLCSERLGVQSSAMVGLRSYAHGKVDEQAFSEIFSPIRNRLMIAGVY